MSERQGTMTLAAAWEVYGGHSGRASESVRRMIAGAVLAVLVKHIVGEGIEWVLVFAMLTLWLDSMQYLVLSEKWGEFARDQELDGAEQSDLVDPPESLNRDGTWLWRAKWATAVTTNSLAMAWVAFG